MLDRRAQEQAPAVVDQELPRLPAVSDNRLLTALAVRIDSAGLPFGAALPAAARLVADAIFESPPQLLRRQFQRNVGQALSALAGAAGRVAAAAGALSHLNAFNAFRQVGVQVSDPVAVAGLALSGARAEQYRLIIERLAIAQENVGALLPRETASALQSGRHPSELVTASGTRMLAVELAAGESNDVVLANVAAAINAAEPRLLARLARPTGNLVQLVLTSRETGSGGAFDVRGAKLVRLIGAAHVLRSAQDAAYVLNGVRTISPQNAIGLQGAKVQLTLRQAAPDVEQIITVGADSQAVMAAITELVDSVGQLATAVNDNVQYLARPFVDDFIAIIQALRPSLAEAGITVQPNNVLQLDQTAFAAAFQTSRARVEDIISSPTGAAPRIGHFAADIMSAPISRIGGPDFIPLLPPASSHPTPRMLLAGNTLSALLYAQLFAQGLFINTLF